MKWYNYKDQWVNLEHVATIRLYDFSDFKGAPNPGLVFNIKAEILELTFKTFEDRDAEFEKIKALMGVKCDEVVYK